MILKTKKKNTALWKTWHYTDLEYDTCWQNDSWNKWWNITLWDISWEWAHALGNSDFLQLCTCLCMTSRALLRLAFKLQILASRQIHKYRISLVYTLANEHVLLVKSRKHHSISFQNIENSILGHWDVLAFTYKSGIATFPHSAVIRTCAGRCFSATGYVLALSQWSSKYGPGWTGSISIHWELVRNANS